MNFKRGFHTDIVYKKFKTSLGKENALEYVHRLWAWCETCKSDRIVLTGTEDMALLMNAPEGLAGKTIIRAFESSGLLVKVRHLIYESPIWAENNRSLLAHRKNGRRGGDQS